MRRGAMGLLAAAVRPVLESRDAITDVPGQIDDVKLAFSSWDNCMRANFCKYVAFSCLTPPPERRCNADRPCFGVF